MRHVGMFIFGFAGSYILGSMGVSFILTLIILVVLGAVISLGLAYRDYQREQQRTPTYNDVDLF